MNLDLDYLNKENPLKKVIIFFILTILWSWLFWLPSVLRGPYFNLALPEWVDILGNVAVFGPSIIGIIMTAFDSKKNLKSLLKSTISFKFNKLWLLVLIVPVVFASISTFTMIYFEGLSVSEVFTEYSLPNFPMFALVFVIILFVGGPIAEEYGWRGYAQDRLQLKFNATSTSLILGIVHALWHLPLFLKYGTVQYESGMPMYEYFLLVIIQTFIYTWVMNNTRSPNGQPNMFLAIMIHQFGNYTSAVFPFFITTLGRWIMFGLNVVFVIVIMIIYKPRRFVREPKIDNEN